MANRIDADLLIVGAGCAGLALGRELALNGAPQRVIIVDSKTEFTDDRTWCFWKPERHQFSSITTKSWSSWRFSAARDAHAHRTSEVLYHHVRGGAYYKHALDVISKAPNVELRLGLAGHALRENEHGVSFETESGPLRARHAVDTRPPQRERFGRSQMFQVFSGAEVTVATSRFDPSTAGLMEAMDVDSQGFRFTYLLPFDEKSALIETTRFSPVFLSPEALDAELTNEISRLARTSSWTVTRREQGVLPMGLPPKSHQKNTRIAHAGSGGGALRAGSGYGFQRIQAWASACAKKVQAGGKPISHPDEPLVRSVADRIFLRALLTNPDRSPAFFLAIARALEAEGFARFMTDQASPMDWMKVALALPKRPFLYAAFNVNDASMHAVPQVKS